MWNILIKNKVLVNEVKFSVLAKDSTDFTPTEEDMAVKMQIKFNKENAIFLHHCDENSSEYYIITRERGQQIRSLKQNKTLYDNLSAELDLQQLNEFLKTDFKFSCIKAEDFETIETITSAESKLIYNRLIEQKFITNDGFLMEIDFSKLDLKELSVFSNEVLAIINIKCIYRIALLRLELMAEKLSQQSTDDTHS